jgi:DNA-nicking Smr family endonuclease
MSDTEGDLKQTVELPIDGVLDLHTFAPRDVTDLVPNYLEACMEREIFEVRIIHGKGTGTLRDTVRAVLDRLPFVVGYSAADGGNWGATVVTLEQGPRS